MTWTGKGASTGAGVALGRSGTVLGASCDGSRFPGVPTSSCPACALEAASTARTAAQNAIRAAEHVEAATRAEARSWTAYAVCFVVCGTLAAGGLGYLLGEQAGQATGEAAGYRTARNEAAAASWANTPAGQTALALDRAGSLPLLAQCNNQGWKVETVQGRRLCIVRPVKDGSIYGWNLP